MTTYEEKVEILVNYFESGEVDQKDQRLGIELEHFIVKSDSLEAVSYYEPGGIEDFLTSMTDLGWKPRYEEGFVIGLEKSDAYITLEPGGQVELSVLPKEDVEQVEEVYLGFLKDAFCILSGTKKSLLAVGYQPGSKLEEIEMVPKERYGYMYDHFKEKGKYAHNMMKASAATHVNFDYTSEEDYIKKNWVANFLTPVIYSVLDNSPFIEGEVYSGGSLRMSIWSDCDPDRSGYPDDVISKRFDYRDYAKYLLNVPVMVYKRGEDLIYSKNDHVKDVLNDQMDVRELEYLLTTVFPHVRTKSHIEIRTADSLPYPYCLAYLTFWKGLLYDRENLNTLYERYFGITSEEFSRFNARVLKRGIKAKLGSKNVLSVYKDLLELSGNGLRRDEFKYLQPLTQIIQQGTTPKLKTLKRFEKGESQVQSLEWCMCGGKFSECVELSGRER